MWISRFSRICFHKQGTFLKIFLCQSHDTCFGYVSTKNGILAKGILDIPVTEGRCIVSFVEWYNDVSRFSSSMSSMKTRLYRSSRVFGCADWA